MGIPDEDPRVMESPSGMILFAAPATGTQKIHKKIIRNIKEKKYVRILIFYLVIVLAQIGHNLDTI
jgi:hypothetical protein